MKLSVVIPVYKVENSLDRCLDSVVQQPIADMEIILVDDGSPDSCPQMCDDWAAKDSRIQVIHQNNRGLSDARNAGIAMATGENITFVDSDDMIDANLYPNLLNMMGNADILEYSIANRTLPDCVYTDLTSYWLGTQAYLHTYSWNKLYKRSLFTGIHFPVDKVFEDVYTTPKLLQKATKIVTTSKGFYHYSNNPQGITLQAGGKELSMLLEGNLQNGMPMDDAYYLYLVNIQMDVVEQTNDSITLPKRHLNIWNFTGKKKIKVILLNLLGISILCKLSKILHLVKKPSRW